MTDLRERLEKLDDLDLLLALVMGEAEGEPLLGKIAVAQVVKKRFEDSRWPITWQEFMLQEAQFTCFSPAYFRPETIKYHREEIAWRECKFAAYGVYNNYIRDLTDGANLYWNPDIIKPNWDWSKVTLLDKIGKHQFARE